MGEKQTSVKPAHPLRQFESKDEDQHILLGVIYVIPPGYSFGGSSGGGKAYEDVLIKSIHLQSKVRQLPEYPVWRMSPDSTGGDFREPIKCEYTPSANLDCPRQIRNKWKQDHAAHRDIDSFYIVLTDLTRDGQTCSNHAEGCGKTLVPGNLVATWSEDVELVKDEVLYIGVYLLKYQCSSLTEKKCPELTCRVGVVRAKPEQASSFWNRVGVITTAHHEGQKYSGEGGDLISHGRGVARVQCLDTLAHLNFPKMGEVDRVVLPNRDT